MKGRADTPNNALTPALAAIGNLWQKEFSDFLFNTQMVALSVHSKINVAPAPQKSTTFYREFLPLRQNIVALLANNYRRYFKVGLAQPRMEIENPHDWAWGQFQSAIHSGVEWICDWYILACSGENRSIRPTEPLNIAPGATLSFFMAHADPFSPSTKSWRAPAWLFSDFATSIYRHRADEAKSCSGNRF